MKSVFPVLLTRLEIRDNQAHELVCHRQRPGPPGGAFQAALKALVPLALRSCLNAKQLNELLKLAFVEVAVEQADVRASNSAIAARTGLTRKEVPRLRALLEAGDLGRDLPLSIAERVLAGWHQDPEFSDAGVPRSLPAGDGPGSFNALMARYGADRSVQAVRAELKAAGYLAEGTAGTVDLRPLGRLIPPDQALRLRALERAFAALTASLLGDAKPGRE